MSIEDKCKGRLAREEINQLTGKTIKICTGKITGEKLCRYRGIVMNKAQLTPVCNYSNSEQ